ncbi:MAG: RecQ family ATP-dependent DNA helicase [Verrucomicrobiales bacterium]
MSESAKTVLKKIFGFDAFRGGQEVVISALLAGRSALAVFPTGGGKSLCFQVPALLLDGLTLVVSPLIALMKDQVDVLGGRGVAAARLDSTLTSDEVSEVFAGMRDGSLKLLYVAPERLANANFQAHLKQCRISLLAIDEAHCISEWGHNFRPGYLKLSNLAGELKVERVLALTATATPAVSADICRAFSIDSADHIQLSFHRPNLHVRVTPCTSKQRKALLVDRVRAAPDSPTIVYVTLQQTAEEVAGFLSREGLCAKAYHAGLADDHRAELQDAFMAGEVNIIVATIAFGMGIDKSNIRAVYHYNLPKSLENYVQEIGRAGRDGESSVCEMLACADDLTVLENFTYGDTPTPQALRQVVDHLLRQGDEFFVSKYHLSTNNDIRPMVISTVLAYLELNQTIAATAPFYNELKIQFLRSEARALAGYETGERDLLARILEAGKRGYKWTTVNIEEVAEALGESEDTIREAITSLEEAGEAILKLGGLRHGYRLLKKPDSIPALAKYLFAMFERREQRDIDRLAQVVAYAESRECLTRYLLEYFGEELADDCGHCGRCEAGVGTVPPSLPHSLGREATADDVAVVHALVAARHTALRTPRQLARFLCGISSPAAARSRLTRKDEFGLLQDVPFQDVLTMAESLNMG